MAREIGFLNRLDVSSDGGTNFFEVCGVSSGTLNLSASTENEQRWKDRGFARPVQTTKEGSIDVEYFGDDADTGATILRNAWLNGENILARWYVDRDDLTKYYKVNIIVESIEITGESDGTSSSKSATLPIVGKITTVGI